MKKPVEFTTTISPFEAADIVLNHHELKDDLLYWEHHVVGDDGKQICTFVFEKYYIRTGGRASLTVILENLEGISKVRCITSGSAESILSFDLGAGGNFVSWFKYLLQGYIADESE
ncbi:DUF6054 family protein [Paenibacillus sp. JX-17]|uniref:DUF6054 family protein n=1 Tax=Paenibacillus lacisoli TaxID=3064525 RepID=A0ABT9C7H7_9BACL|nr:DUF6054 family protein [Paenibacillus sp. JX-17]MDO7905225.1 DUF6054 family protein [Paenibacillus sp. JX-17]